MWLSPGNELSVYERDPADVRLSASLTLRLAGLARRNFKL